MARLRILESAEGAGRVVKLTGVEFLVGRDDACDVVVRDRSLSRRHARFAPAVGGWLVIDQESGNGTFVNRQRVHEAILKDGDEISFGLVRVLFEDPPAGPETIVLRPGAEPPPAPWPESDVPPPGPGPVTPPRRRAAPPPPPAPPLPPPPPLPPLAAAPLPVPARGKAVKRSTPPPRAGRSRSASATTLVLVLLLVGIAVAGAAGFLVWRTRGRMSALSTPKAAVPTAPSGEERTPLDAGAAIDVGDAARLVEVLAGGADPNATGADGLTLVQRAAWAGRANVSKLLVSKGADLARRDPFGLTPAERALAEGRCETAMVLVPKDLLPAGSDGRGYLHRAAEGGCAAAVKELVGRGAAVDAADVTGLTPLHVAALSGRSDVVGALLSNGASVAKATPSGRTALHLASLAGRAEAVRALLAKGADPNGKDATGRTPLHLAAAAGDAETVSALLAAEADPSLGGPDGTSLEVALSSGAWEVAELLAPPGT